jgi:hypothetical protein
LMERIGLENALHALHAEDAGMSDEELGELLAADLRDRVRRNVRYRAAGEYVSTYCDLLIAVCGQVDADEEPPVDALLPRNARSGTEQIVRSHLRGLAPGILPVGTALTWADNGPVLRIYCPREGVTAIGKGGPAVGDIHVWHPFDSRLPGEVAKVWHARKMKALRAQAERLEALGAAWKVPRPVDGGETAGLMGGGRGFVPKNVIDEYGLPVWYAGLGVVNYMRDWAGLDLLPVPAEIAKEGRASDALRPPAFGERLERMAVLRRVAANANQEIDVHVKRFTAEMFKIAVVIVVLMQVADNWITVQGGAQPTGWRSWLFVLAVALFVAGRIRYQLRDGEGLLDRQNDWRAIGEGMRVQFYWSAAGLGRSVASTYLQRLRGDVGWIRGAISSVAFPYEVEAAAFQRLSRREKLERLRAVSGAGCSEQETYFAKATHEQESRRRRLRTGGNLCLVAALGLVIGNFWIEQRRGQVPDWMGACGCGMLGWLLGCGVMGWLVLQFITFRVWRDCYAEKPADEGLVSGSGSRWVRALRALQVFDHWGWLWLAGLSLGLAIVSAVYTMESRPWLAIAEKRGGMAKNLLLASGALLHAWAAVKFANENCRRYGAMRDLFRAAGGRIGEYLDAAAEHLEASEAAGSHAVAVAVAEAEAFDRVVGGIQSALVDLGQEALHENTDWLLMHRNKPVEPIVPSG